MTDIVALPVTLTRSILSVIANAANPLIIDEIGLSTAAVTPDADMTSVPDELQRWPVLDGYTQNGNIAVYAEFPWTGSAQMIHTVAFYAGGQLVGVYSAADVEAVLTSAVMLDMDFVLSLATLPAGSVTVTTTGLRYNQRITICSIRGANPYTHTGCATLGGHGVMPEYVDAIAPTPLP